MDDENRDDHRTGGRGPEASGPDPATSAREAAEAAWAALGPFPNHVLPDAHDGTQAYQSGRIVFRVPLAAEEIERKMLAREEMHAQASRAYGEALSLSHLPPGPWSTIPPPQEDQERTEEER